MFKVILILCILILWQIMYFLQLGSIFCWNAQKKRKKANREKLNVGRQFFKDVMCIFLMLLCVTLLHEGKIPFLRKNHHLYPQFPFINPPSVSNEDFHLFHLPLFITAALPATFLINYIFPGKINWGMRV